jgi:predicted nucleotidyltransferase
VGPTTRLDLDVRWQPRELSPEEVTGYREADRHRHQHEQRAWALARQVAVMLRQQFQVDQILVFGSLAHPGCFTPWSDVDVTVWGPRPEDTFRAIGMAMHLDPEIAVNLVDVATCPAALLRVIEQEGIPL